MTTGQLMIILLLAVFSGWLTGWLIIKLLFWPTRPVGIGPWKIAGLFPMQQKRIAEKAGQLAESEFSSYKGLEEKIADPLLIAGLRPEIEKHIDHFLQVKIKAIFPVIAPFLGEKTLNQFKSALLAEIDSLLPDLLLRYSASLKAGIKPGSMVTERINAITVNSIRSYFHTNASGQIRAFQLLCAGIGLLTGLLSIAVILLTGV